MGGRKTELEHSEVNEPILLPTVYVHILILYSSHMSVKHPIHGTFVLFSNILYCFTPDLKTNNVGNCISV